MIKGGLAQFKGKRILLLQGPVGPFFRRLAEDLEWAGAQVCKINFNGGDWVFYPQKSTLYRGTPEEWPAFFEQFVAEKGINFVFLFGDCRPIHIAAHGVARRLGIEVGVFEEGYIRPDYVTFERFGVNAHSSLPRNPLVYLHTSVPTPPAPQRVRPAFWITARWAMLYYAASHACRWLFPHYRHHRPLQIWEGLHWLRGFWRRWHYRILEEDVETTLSGPLSGKYFLAALQVHVDSQIHVHSGFGSVQEFIGEVMTSFASNASPEDHLVIKHHPLDRGYHDYTRFIDRHSRQLAIEGRVHYIHDQHLPLLLDHAKGVVVINSTVGMSAVHHGKAVKVCGDAFYDMQGLTFQGSLDAFWQKAPHQIPDPDLYLRFRNYLILTTQLNGNFYRRLHVPGVASGLVWADDSEKDAAAADTNAAGEPESHRPRDVA